MSKIPCRKCTQCGKYNDFTIDKCECGKELNNIEAELVDTEKISSEQYGKIDISRKIYVQKCPRCGALNYIKSPSDSVKVCSGCGKAKIAQIKPEEYVDEEKIKKNDEADDSKSHISQDLNLQDADFSQENNDESAEWQEKANNIRKTVGDISTSSDTEDEEVVDWSSFLGNINEQNTASSKLQDKTDESPKNIMLTAVRYGNLSFMLEAGTNKYMLGRTANQSDFLSQDNRVGREHCYLFYRNGNWFVRDNKSQNGTMVNSRDIGENGEYMLSDGDELKLGHHNDSMAFHISII